MSLQTQFCNVSTITSTSQGSRMSYSVPNDHCVVVTVSAVIATFLICLILLTATVAIILCFTRKRKRQG